MCDGETKIKRKKSPSRARDHGQEMTNNKRNTVPS